MSLTSEIKNLQSPTILYFRENFPDKKNFAQDWKKRTKDLPSILPQDESHPYPWTLIGHAIDYRIRLFYKKYRTIDTVARNECGAIIGYYPRTKESIIDLDWFQDSGVYNSSHLMNLDPEKYNILKWPTFSDIRKPKNKKAFDELKRKTRIWGSLSKLFDDLSVDVVGKMPSSEIERQITLCCIVLSYYEIQSRTGEPNELILRANTLEDLFSVIPEIVIDDLVCLFQAFFESDNPFPAKEDIILNPTFSGSSDVGGADGDIIIDHVLWDFKATKNPIQLKNLFWPYQLIGYALLDYYDLYSLTGCGIYLVRQARWFSWSFEELFSLLGSDPEIDISAHRECFRNSISQSRE